MKEQISKMIVKSNYIREYNGKISVSISGLLRSARNDEVGKCNGEWKYVITNSGVFS